LLLNGLGAPLELWQPLVDHLPRRRIIAFDTPGTGGSPPTALPLPVAGHALLALSLLGQLGFPRADVVGFSFGGLVAQELALLAPARVRRLVLASTSCGWGGVPGDLAALLAISTPDRYYSPAAFFAAAGRYVGGRELADRRFLRRQAQVRASHPPSQLGYLYQCWAAATWSSWGRLPMLTQPTLVLAGDRDPLVPPGNANVLAAGIPRARRHLVAGGGHLCLLERAAELAPVVDSFLDGPASHPVAPR